MLLLGFGNAALETVDAVRPYAADIVVMGRGHTTFRPDPPAAVKRA